MLIESTLVAGLKDNEANEIEMELEVVLTPEN